MCSLSLSITLSLSPFPTPSLSFLLSTSFHTIFHQPFLYHLSPCSPSLLIYIPHSIPLLSLYLSPCRRDSAIIKEEIKTFLGNRRISQAVVAQVTGQFLPAGHHSNTLISLFQ